MLRNIALVILAVLFASELKNYNLYLVVLRYSLMLLLLSILSFSAYHDDKVKVYLLLTQSGEENTTLLPIVMSSNFPENISLKDLLHSVPDNCKINVPHLGIVSETGVSASVHNYSAIEKEPSDNKSNIYREYLHQFPNKSKYLNDSAVKKNRIYNRSVILKKLHSKASIKANKLMKHNSEQLLNNSHGTIDKQSTINKSLVEAIDLKNDTRDNLEEYHKSSNVSQGIILKKLHSKMSVKSNNLIPHSSRHKLSTNNKTTDSDSSTNKNLSSGHKLSNNNKTTNNDSSMNKNFSDASTSSNVSREEVYGNHDIRDVYYVIHTCSQKRCQIHQVVVLKRGTVQEEDMEAILQTINQSQYSTHNRYCWLNEWQVLFTDIISGIQQSEIRNIQWLLPAIILLTLTLLTKFIYGVYTYKKKVDVTYLFLEQSISDIKELADILKICTTSQITLERRILFACNKETDNETQIRNMENEIAHLKISIRRMDGTNTVNMDDFVTAVLNYLQNCLESGADLTTDAVQPWPSNTMTDLNYYGQLM